jgi:hypothetical protein
VHAVEQGIGIHELPPSQVRKDLESWAPLLGWLDQRLNTPLTPRDLRAPLAAIPRPAGSPEAGRTAVRPDPAPQPTPVPAPARDPAARRS